MEETTMKKRLLSILMVLCLAVSLVTPVVAVGEEPITYTDGTEDGVSQDTENSVEDSTPQDTETTTEDPSGEQGTNTPVAQKRMVRWMKQWQRQPMEQPLNCWQMPPPMV